jgi:hypothetical protein
VTFGVNKPVISALGVTDLARADGVFVVPVAAPAAQFVLIAATGGGASVSLASSNTSAATVPSKVTVPKGATTTTFTVTALNVATAASVTITATGSNNAQHASLMVAPPNVPTLASLAIQSGSWTTNVGNPPHEVFGYGFVGTITLTGPAPAGGAVITLTGSRDNILSVPWNPDNVTPPPNSVTVPAGQTTVLALMSQTPFLGTQRGTIVTASYNGITLSQTVWVPAQSTSFARQESVQCASLALGPCLTAMTPVALNTGDISGYNLYTPELLAETGVCEVAPISLITASPRYSSVVCRYICDVDTPEEMRVLHTALIEPHDARVESVVLPMDGSCEVRFKHLAVYKSRGGDRFVIWSYRAALELESVRRIIVDDSMSDSD